MAVKTKDYTVNLTDFTEDGKLINANKKTAIRIDGLTQANVETLSFVYDENKQLVITNTDNNTKLIVSNPSAIKYIKTDYVKNGKKETYNLTDIISNNLVDNLTMVAYNKKKKAYIGTNYNDTFTGTAANETFTGGLGKNLIYYIKGFGNDVINLTKNEKLTLDISGINGINSLRFEYNKKDLRIYTDKNDTSSSAEFITLKNFASKDVTGANGSVEIKIGSEIYDLRSNQKEGEYWCEIVPKGNFTGGWMNDHINAKSTAEIIKKGKHVDLVLNGGKGNDLIESSMFADKITGGVGRNTVKYTSLTQLDGDKITLTKGENLIIDVSEITQNPNNISYTVSGKNLVVTVADGDETKNFTIMNFGTKDVTNNKTKKSADTSSVELKLSNSVTVDLRNEIQVTASSGTWHNDLIDKSDYKIYKDKKKTIVQTDTSKKGLTINGAAGNDEIIGTNYSDTIKAGVGTGDNITGGTGNDKLYASTTKGSNTTFNFKAGDGKDTVYSGKGEDTLKFYDINLDTLKFEQGTKKNNKDLIIKYSDNDAVTVKNYYTVNKKGKITGINKNNTIKNIIGNGTNFIIGSELSETIDGTSGKDIIYANGGNDVINANAGDDVIFLGAGNSTVKIDMSMFEESEWSTPEYTDYVESCTKTIYLNDDTTSTLTIDFDKTLFDNGLGVFCRGTGQDRDLYISMSNAVNPGYGIVIKNYFDENGNPRTNQVKLNIWEGEETPTAYTVPEWTTATLMPWEHVFDVQPFGPYEGEIHGTNMPHECLLYSAGFGDDTIYGGNGNIERIYLNGGHDIVHSNEGTKNISIGGNQTDVELYLGSEEATKTNIHLGLVEGNVASNINDAGDLLVSWDCYANNAEDPYIYSSTLSVAQWNSRTSSATFSIGGNNRDNTLNAINGVANTLDGGDGDDILIGGTGVDTFNFMWNQEYGIDTVKNYTSDDVLRFESASSYGVDFTKFKYYTNNEGKGLVINTKNRSDEDSYVIIDNYFESDNKIDTVTTYNWKTDDETKSLATMYGNKDDLGCFDIGIGGEYSGTDKEDIFVAKSGTNTYEGGKGVDAIHARGGESTFVFNAGDGSDVVYQEGGTITLKFNDATIEELTSKTGYDKGDGYTNGYNDLLIHYDGENTLIVKDFYWTSHNHAVKIIDSTGTEYNMTDCFKDVKNINSISDFYMYPATNKDDDIRILSDTTGVTQIAGKNGSDRIWGSNADEEIFSHKADYSYDTTAGVVDEIHAGGGDDVIFAWSDTNIVYGDAGDDTIYVNVGQKSIVSDSSGTADVLSINPVDDSDIADYDKMHFVFNVNSEGVVDDAGLRILTAEEYELWKADTNDAAIRGINVVKDSQGNGGWDCIETFIDADDDVLLMSQIDAVKEQIASWLSDEGYATVAGVFGNALEKSAEASAADIATLVAKFDSIQTMWS